MANTEAEQGQALCLTDDERSDITILLATTQSISTIARQTGHNECAVDTVLQDDPKLQELRAAAFFERKILILERLLAGWTRKQVRTRLSISHSLLDGLVIPISKEIATALRARPWTGEDMGMFNPSRPRVDPVITRFRTGHATVHDVITAVREADQHLAEDLLIQSVHNAATRSPQPPPTPFTTEERRQIARLRDEEKKTWEEIAQHFPGRSADALQRRYSQDRKAQVTN
ncbi:Myb-like DNA-binding domain-containing protein [Saccharopolyspora antimicrobica]|uniref:Myb-like DNA-binding domain-containing protein n=1 Tax=Saccharopolyspora antimicrobica TaxID=455193 RepID=A0A1I5AV42_9PSEU|nr:SANT/Myb-like DNA-binding domain-containing protein [Saccharopolyspora antimicrobica]RKT86375.1 Myb-like DNA-binding protein [Saccharopolyspora antimicrobica]SFN66281.1 Myb-like DNA-binding domain-containing protein [Saccharopolyspora antimicrobica]